MREPIGIGRPASEAWVEELTSSFKEQAPDGTRLDLRRTPAISYVSPEEYAQYAGLISPEEQAKNVQTMLGNLAANKQIDPATASRTLRLRTSNKRLRLRDYGAHLPAEVTDYEYQLAVQVYDVEDTIGIYPEKFVMLGEKVAHRKELGLGINTPNGTRVRHVLRVGTLHSERPLWQEELRNIRHAIPGRPDVGPVGPIYY